MTDKNKLIEKLINIRQELLDIFDGYGVESPKQKLSSIDTLIRSLKHERSE